MSPQESATILHPSRRIQHVLTGLIILSLSQLIPPYPLGSSLLLLALLLLLHLHSKRITDRSHDEWYLRHFGALLRDDERGTWNDHDRKPPVLPGAFYFLLGTFLASMLFEKDAARTALLVLSVADPVAGVAGVWASQRGWNVTWRYLGGLLGRSREIGAVGGGPTLVGSIACGTSAFLCTYVYFPPGTGLTLPWRIGVGVVTAVVEGMAGRDFPVMGMWMDDNMWIPLAVGGMISCLVG